MSAARWIVAALVIAGVAVVWSTRPFSTGAIRYAAWRIVSGHGFATGSVVSGDARIGFRTIGPLEPGPAAPTPLVLLHGGFGTDLDWYAQIPALARRHALVLVDSRGHGGSTLGHQALTYALLADDLLAVLDALGLERVDIAGWSDGGNTGLLFAHAHADRVRRLVAISANARPDGLEPRVRDALAGPDDLGSPPSRWLRALFSPEPERWEELAGRVTALWSGHPRLDAADLGDIGVPTLLIAGDRDDIRPDHLEAMAHALPDAELVLLPDVGHFVPQTAPAKVLGLIEAFLDDPP